VAARHTVCGVLAEAKCVASSTAVRLLWGSHGNTPAERNYPPSPCAVPCCAVLCYPVLCCAVLSCTVLFYTDLFCAVLRCIWDGQLRTMSPVYITVLRTKPTVQIAVVKRYSKIVSYATVVKTNALAEPAQLCDAPD